MMRRRTRKDPPFFMRLEAEVLLKVVTSNKSVLVANDQVLEFMYNLFLEGEKSIDIISPEGWVFTRTTLNPGDWSNDTVGNGRMNFMKGRHHPPKIG